MVVEDTNRSAETFDQVKKRLVEYAEKAEFDSLEYKALSDYADLQLLSNSLSTDLRNLTSEKDAAEKTRYETEIQLDIMRIALLEHSIREGQRDIKGYDKACSWIASEFETHLPLAIDRETTAQFPNNGQRQAGEASALHEEVFNTIQDSVYRKRE